MILWIRSSVRAHGAQLVSSPCDTHWDRPCKAAPHSLPDASAEVSAPPPAQGPCPGPQFSLLQELRLLLGLVWGPLRLHSPRLGPPPHCGCRREVTQDKERGSCWMSQNLAGSPRHHLRLILLVKAKHRPLPLDRGRRGAPEPAPGL